MQTCPRADRPRGWAQAMLLVLALLPLGCGGPRISAPVEARTVQDEPVVKSKPAAPEVGGRAVPPAAPREPGDWRPESYVVRKGDTLYSIALDHGLDYRELASWNGLADPNRIHVDQRLSLHAPAGWQPPPEPMPAPAAAPTVVAQPLPPPPEIEAKPLAPLAVKTGPKAIKLAYSDAALAQLRGEPAKPAAAAPAAPARTDTRAVAAPKPAPVTPPGPVATVAKPAAAAAPTTDAGWIWPTSGPLLHGFNQGPNPKGVAIGGEPGQAVVASAAGKVVYSGSGLRGYGKLIIIKHSDTYLSVYAHNKTLLVKEGERVARGQKIAEMGDSDSQRVALHFEIRRLGKPVDPLQYLPEGGA